MKRPHVYLLYHFFHPDDVISARLYSDLAQELSRHGHHVTAFPSVRSCHSETNSYRRTEAWKGGDIVRIWRPNFSQSSTLGRLANTLFLLLGWTWKAATYNRFTSNAHEAVVIGTDPVFGILASIPWRVFRPRIKIIHWCHDVHPSASIADGRFSRDSWIVRALNYLMAIAYRRCDTIVDLGPCMRRVLKRDGNLSKSTNHQTITPWSLVEPKQSPTVDTNIRQALFGDCRLGLLYSGNLGRAHDVSRFIALARLCRQDGINFCFAGRGVGLDKLKSELTGDDSNITFAGFADEKELELRLAAADAHLVSLKDAWTGTVVPSKFFGAIATGRPVLYSGDADSSIAEWIEQFQIGWSLTATSNLSQIRSSLLEFANSLETMRDMQLKCIDIYRNHFSKQKQLEKFATELSSQ